MSQLIETPWKRYGKDRVYVRTEDGHDIGYVDLQAGTVAKVEPGFEAALEECRQRWITAMHQPRPVVSGDTASTRTKPTVAEPASTAVKPAPRDLATNVAGAHVRAKREEVNSEAPVRNFVARVLGVKTEERAWRVGAKGEEKVADQLAKLGPSWRVLHSIEVGDRGSDIDHVVIGAAGVFTLNAKRHPNGRVSVNAWKIYVNGQPTDYLRNARGEADRAQRLLSAACGTPVAVSPVVVFVDLDDFKVKQAPQQGVHVTTHRRLVDWLQSLPATASPGAVEQIFAKARINTTWQA